MIVEIATGVRETLVAEAARAAPSECCGLLLGRTGRIENTVAAANIAADPTRGFEIDPATLLRTHRAARGDGQRVIGHYHSHPNASPQPSLRDAARAAADGQIWLIVAAGAVTAWTAVAGEAGVGALHGRFVAAQLQDG